MGTDSDWSYETEQAVAGALGMVPGIGSLLSALTYMLWPSTDDVWGEIQQQVQDLIGQDLSQYDQQQVTDALQGLQGVINNFLVVVNTTTEPSYIAENWTAANSLFIASAPTFQDSTYGVALLPLFAQFVNLHLSLLRDGVLFGSQWGFEPDVIAEIQKQLTTAITNYTEYANKTYVGGFTYQYGQWQAPLSGSAISKPIGSGSFSSGEQYFLWNNTYIRQLTRTVLDFVSLWPYFDPSSTTYPATIRLTSEIYSDPAGTAQGWRFVQGSPGQLGVPTPPTQPMQQLTLWAYDNLDAVQATYPEGCGPNGVTTTARQGDQNGGSNVPPHGGVFDVATNPIVQVWVFLWGGEPSGVQLQFQDGTTAVVGEFDLDAATSFSYSGQIVSSVYINGVGTYGSADCVFFGFQYQNPNLISVSTVETMYITDPTLESLQDLLNRLPAGSVDPTVIEQTATAEGWQALRAAYWQALSSPSSGSVSRNRTSARAQ